MARSDAARKRYAGWQCRDTVPTMEAEEVQLPSRAGREGLDLDLRPEKLTIGITSLAVSWTLDMRNVSESELVALRIWSDLSAAHGGGQAREQLSDPHKPDASLHKISRLSPGKKGRIKGEWSFPLARVPPVESAKATMVLPMARFRFIGAGLTPFRVAFLIGLPPEPGSGRLKPVRLDQGTQAHKRIAAKLLA